MINTTSFRLFEELQSTSVSSFTRLAMIGIVLLGIAVIEFQMLTVMKPGVVRPWAFAAVVLPLVFFSATVVIARFVGLA